MVWSPAYEVDIGAHVFPTVKYRLVLERLRREGVLERCRLLEPEPATREDLAGVHTGAYLEKIEHGRLSPLDEMRLELPFSHPLREASVLCCGGTILAAKQAVAHGVAVHLGGGFHHAFPDHGEGFCLLNDVAVAARALRTRGTVRRVAVVDLDVHHGNGTAAIFADDPSVFTFSMHQQWNYPARKPPGDLDVGLEDGTGDAEYLGLLRRHLPEVLSGHRPELVIYLAGADPWREDQLGGLALGRAGLRERDRVVLDASRRAGAAVAVTLAGGYARDGDDTIGIHVATVRECVRALGRPADADDGGAPGQ